MKNAFRKLNKVEQRRMSKTMSEAFYQHDNFIYLIENEKRRLKVVEYLFRFMTRVINKFGYIYVVYQDEQAVGYITFMDDQKNTLAAKTVFLSNAIWMAVRFWLSITCNEKKRYLAYFKQYNKLKHEEKNIIHLYYTGVKTDYKGKGIMKKAMNEALLYFKELGYKGVCLETSDRSNIGLYKHLGYQITQSVKTKDERQEIFFFKKYF